MPLPPTPPLIPRRLAAMPGAGDALLRLLDEPPLGGNRVTLLEGGEAALRAMEDAIDAAQNHVNLDGALLEADGAGERLLRRLAARSRAGVRTNVLVDPLGPLGPSGAWHAALHAAGVRLCERDPVQRRLMVIDGAIAFVGTAAPRPGSLALLLAVQGPAVQRLQRLFVTHWQRRAQGAMLEARLFPPLAVAGTQRVAVVAGRADRAALALTGALAAARVRVLASTGGQPPAPRFVAALAHAAQRGVRVDLLLPGPADERRARHAARGHYGRLLKAGVRLHERRGMVAPAEACVIDGLWTSIGAGAEGRDTARAAGHADLVVVDEDFARRFEPLLRLHLALAQPVDARAWRARPWWQRLQDAVAGRLEGLR